MTPIELLQKEGYVLEKSLRKDLDRSELFFRARIREIALANPGACILCNGTLDALKDSIENLNNGPAKQESETLLGKYQKDLDYFRECQKALIAARLKGE